MRKEFGEVLLHLLRITGTPNSALAKEIGTAGSTIQNWIDGKTSPKIDLACKIADIFGVTMDELCGFDEITDEKEEEIKKRRGKVRPNSRRVEYYYSNLSANDKAELNALKEKACKEIKGEE